MLNKSFKICHTFYVTIVIYISQLLLMGVVLQNGKESKFQKEVTKMVVKKFNIIDMYVIKGVCIFWIFSYTFICVCM